VKIKSFGRSSKNHFQRLKDLPSYESQTLIFNGLQRSERNFKNNWKEYVKQNFKNRKLHRLLHAFLLARTSLITNKSIL